MPHSLAVICLAARQSGAAQYGYLRQQHRGAEIIDQKQHAGQLWPPSTKQLRSPATTPDKEEEPRHADQGVSWQTRRWRQWSPAHHRRRRRRAAAARANATRQKWGRGGAHHAGTRTGVRRSSKGAAHGTGRRLCLTGAFDAALADLAAALALSKNGARASIHFLRGEVFSKIERSEEAIQAYSACLAENPSHAKAAYRRAACRNPLDARAADDYEAALALGRDIRYRAPSPSPNDGRRCVWASTPTLRNSKRTLPRATSAPTLTGHMRTMLQTTCRMRSRNTPRRSACCRRMRWPGTTGASAASGSATPAAALDDFTQAIQRAEASPQTHPLADFYHNRAFCRRKLADFSGRDRRLLVGTRAGPESLQSSVQSRLLPGCFLGIAIRKLHALVHTRRRQAALVVEPRNPSAHHNRGVVLEKSGGSRTPSKRSTRPSTAACRRTPSITTRAARMRGTAATTLRRSRRSQPRSSWTRATGPPGRTAPTPAGSLGISWARDGTTGRLCRRADGQALQRARYCSAKLEKFDAAVADYTEALRLDPANAHARTTAASRMIGSDATTRPRAT